jgi:hypothetical protein
VRCGSIEEYLDIIKLLPKPHYSSSTSK